MRPGNVAHMDVVADAGAVAGGIIAAKYREFFALAYGGLGDVG